MFDTFVSLSGLIASIWIVFGVYIAGKFYPNYSHTKQFCSELGAIGSPTKNLSPLINNYPLGLLFCLFGWYVCNTAESLPLLLAGFMVIIHGVGTLVAGYFAMDNDPLTKNPSFECKVHSWAGMFVLLSLLIAPVLIVFTPENKSFSLSFKLASICCVVISIALLVRMVKEFKSNGKPGLYQRLAYGAQLVWLSALSIILA